MAGLNSVTVARLDLGPAIRVNQGLFSEETGQGLANTMAYGLVPVQSVQEVSKCQAASSIFIVTCTPLATLSNIPKFVIRKKILLVNCSKNKFINFSFFF